MSSLIFEYQSPWKPIKHIEYACCNSCLAKRKNHQLIDFLYIFFIFFYFIGFNLFNGWKFWKFVRCCHFFSNSRRINFCFLRNQLEFNWPGDFEIKHEQLMERKMLWVSYASNPFANQLLQKRHTYKTLTQEL